MAMTVEPPAWKKLEQLMFKRITELFKAKPAAPDLTTISLDDIPGWLDSEEKTCIARRTEKINKSRAVISKAREDILQLLSDFGSEDLEKALHPKVEQVNRHNLPQFKRKIESSFDVAFSEDDEIYYRQVAEMVDGCFKAYRGPGRYLHHLYGDEIKLFRQFMDQIGRELNQLTDVVKKSREHIGRIETIRSALKRYQGSDGEAAAVAGQQAILDQRRSELVADLCRITGERDEMTAGAGFEEYSRRSHVHEEEVKRVSDLYETVESDIRTALPVWRKVIRIVQDERHKEEEKLLDQLIQQAVLQKYDDPEFLVLVRSTAVILFRYLDNEAVPIKNSFEKSLFVSAESYADQISSAIITWQNADHAMQEERHILTAHPAVVHLSALNERIAEINREIKHIDEESGRNQGRTHHISREKGEAVREVCEEMKELSGGTMMVQGFTQETGEDA